MTWKTQVRTDTFRMVETGRNEPVSGLSRFNFRVDVVEHGQTYRRRVTVGFHCDVFGVRLKC